MRQAAEWGMHAIQSLFPCLKDTFVYEDTGERHILMKMVCLLYNLRARTVGINQIKNVFMKQFPDPCMTAKLHIGGGCSISLVPCTTRPTGSARLILLSER